jgi:Ni/Co efflux regulator RcnB
MDKEHTMQIRKVVTAVMALSVGASGAAFAQGNPRMEDFPQWQQGTDRQIREQGLGDQNRRAADRGAQRGQPDRGYRGDQRVDQRDYRGDQRDYYRGNAYQGDWRGRGAGPDHSWYRGSRLPPQYNSRYYVVDDWRGHHLSAPPRGYHWVQAGNDYVLAAIATGIITSILLNQ